MQTTDIKSLKFTRRRLEVLRAAAKLFSGLGFHRASLSDLGEALGMTPAALYYYVHSKDDMLFQCGQVALEQLKNALDSAHSEGRCGLEKLEIFFALYAEVICDDFGRCLVLTNASDLEGESRERNLAGRRDLDRAVREIIGEGIADGSIRKTDERDLTTLLFGALNSVPRWWSPNGKRSPSDIARAYTDLVVRGVAPQK